MEISLFLLTKMLFVAFLFGIQSGIIFDALKAIRGICFGDIKSQKVKKLYGVKLPFSKRIFCAEAKKRTRVCKNIFMFFCDFLWVIYSSLGIIVINYSYNDGGIRFFTVFSFIIGFTVYYFTASRVIIFLLELASFGFKYTFFVILDALSFPFLKIYNNLVKKIKKRFGNIRLCLEKKSKKVYNVSEEVCADADNINKCAHIKISIRKNQRKGRAEDEKK